MNPSREVDGRVHRCGDGAFVMIANATLRDPRLSYRAKGVLAACLTHTADFSLTRGWIDSHGTEGRDAITSAIHELRQLGYVWDEWVCQSPPVRRMVWSDAPDPSADGDGPEKPSDGKSGATEKPSDGKPVGRIFSGAIRKPLLQKNNSEENQSLPLTPRPRPRGARRPRQEGANPRALGLNLRADAAEPPAAVDRQGDGRGARADGSKPRAQQVDPLSAQLPEALEVHRQAIAEFWKAKRQGSARTPAAFSLLLRELERIQAVEPGAVAEQLEAATQAGWSSITFRNWDRYGRSEIRGTRLAYGGHGSLAEANAAQAKRLMDSWGVFNEPGKAPRPLSGGNPPSGPFQGALSSSAGALAVAKEVLPWH